MAAAESSETARSIASLMPANERHKGDWQQRLRADRPIGKLLYQHQLLDKKGGANRNDHAAARFELLEQGWWNLRCRCGDDDAVEWRCVWPSIITVPLAGVDRVVTEFGQSFCR